MKNYVPILWFVTSVHLINSSIAASIGNMLSGIRVGTCGLRLTLTVECRSAMNDLPFTELMEVALT